MVVNTNNFLSTDYIRGVLSGEYVFSLPRSLPPSLPPRLCYACFVPFMYLFCTFLYLLHLLYFQGTDNPAVQLQGPFVIDKLVPPPAHRNVVMICAGTGINPSACVCLSLSLCSSACLFFLFFFYDFFYDLFLYFCTFFFTFLFCGGAGGIPSVF